MGKYTSIPLFTWVRVCYLCNTKPIYNDPVGVNNLNSRYRLRFFNQVVHQTTSAFIENEYFFTKSCHHQIYWNYEQPPQSLQNLYFQSNFLASKIKQIFLIFFCEEYLTRRSNFIYEMFWKLRFLKYFASSNCAKFLFALFIILVGLTMTLFSDKMLSSHRCICGLVPNLIKKSWTVSTWDE